LGGNIPVQRSHWGANKMQIGAARSSSAFGGSPAALGASNSPRASLSVAAYCRSSTRERGPCLFWLSGWQGALPGGPCLELCGLLSRRKRTIDWGRQRGWPCEACGPQRAAVCRPAARLFRVARQWLAWPQRQWLLLSVGHKRLARIKISRAINTRLPRTSSPP